MKKSGYTEIRMGSPLFGRITIRGARLNTKGRSFGEAMAFSQNSRFLAAEELVGVTSDSGPHTRAVVFDLHGGAEIVVHDQDPGFVRRIWWEPDGSLSLLTWSYLQAEIERTAIWKPD